MAIPYPEVGIAASQISESNMDMNGVSNANDLKTELGGKTIDLVDMKKKVNDKCNIVLDETGMLATKTKEYLKKISEEIGEISKIDLLKIIGDEGYTLYTNWKMEQNRIASLVDTDSSNDT